MSPNPLHFPADAVLTVDAHNGPEVWTGQRWNEYVDQADRNGGMITVRILGIGAADQGTEYCDDCGRSLSGPHCNGD
jgi:hypothetical protein